VVEYARVTEEYSSESFKSIRALFSCASLDRDLIPDWSPIRGNLRTPSRFAVAANLDSYSEVHRSVNISGLVCDAALVGAVDMSDVKL
jgi:hypothetical protein